MNKLKYINLFFKNIESGQIFYLALTLILIICASLCTTSIPLLLKIIIDHLNLHEGYISIIHLISLYALILILERLFNEAQFLSYPIWENNILKNAYKISLEALFNSHPNYFKNKLYGTITSQIYRAVSGLDMLMFDVIFKTFPILVNFVFIITSIIFTLNINIAFIIIFGAIIYMLTIYILNSKLITSQTVLRDSINYAQGLTTDLVYSWKDIKLTNSHSHIKSIINNEINAMLAHSKRFYFKRGMYGFIQSLVICSIVIFANYYEINKFLNASSTIGSIVLVNNYLLLLLRPLESFSLILRGLSKNYSDFVALEEIINYEKESITNVKKPVIVNSIHLSNIKVGNIINSLNLAIYQGQKIAIIGPSGAGKSTLLNILTGLHSDYEGEIYINNDLNQKMDPLNLRMNIAYCSADARLITQSIKNNISPVKSEYIKNILQSVSLSEKINILENGINTVISEKSQLLSSGEIQRIKIARTIALDRDYELYDEAISALDNDCVENILNRLLSRKDKTIIFITHNTKFLGKFDKVYSLVNGCLSEIYKEYNNA